MTTRNFDALFEPRSIVLIGASNEPHSVGAVIARNLFEAGFDGPILTVNPHERSIRSTLNYRSVAELPTMPDLAVIATPPQAVPGVIAEIGKRGCRAAIVVAAGFGEGDRLQGKLLEQQMLDAARPHLLRILGPNCLGFISPGRGINASFAHLTPAAGEIAFLTQSGAIATAVLDWAAGRGIGFSHVVSLGGAADIDFGDMLDYMALDRHTTAIVLYVESIVDARKFMSAGRIAARSKPVIVIKSGRSQAGAKAAHSHTGAMAGADAVYDAAFHRAGMLRVNELADLFTTVETLGAGLKVRGDRLAILTNGGGLGVIAADAAVACGGELAELSPETMARLDRGLPAAWSRGNPVDVLGDATGERYRMALEALLEDPGQDAVLVINCPTAVADSLEAAQGVCAVLSQQPERPVLTCWAGENAAASSRRLFAAKRVPTYETPESAAAAFMNLVRYRRHQDLLLETPPANSVAAVARDVTQSIIAAALAQGRTLLSEAEAKEVLAACGIPVVETLSARDPAEARAQAARIAGPKVLKIVSPDITHKSDVGGVRLDLATPEAVELAAQEMLEAVRARAPNAQLTGFTVQPLVRRPHAQELIAGIAQDPTFGPVILVGQGGVAAEVIGDRAIGLPPLNLVLARHMIDSTRVAKLLAGFRDHPPADIDAIATVLIRLAALAADVAEIAELDINPLLADEHGVVALDARIAIRPRPTSRVLPIRPYPTELEKRVPLSSGGEVFVRPVRPEDEPALIELVARSTPEDRRLRFLAPLKVLPHAMAARLSQIDYDREMGLVASETADSRVILGVVRLVADPEIEKAEFAVMVRSDQKGRGLGYALMLELLAYARQRRLTTLYSDVLAENGPMLQMARELGFKTVRDAADTTAVRVVLDLSSLASDGPVSAPL